MESPCSERVLIVAPMAAGKTEIFLSYLSKMSDKKVLIVLDKQKLAEQTYLRALRYGIDTTVNYSGDIVPINKKGMSRATITLIQSIHKISIKYFDVLIIDECHVAFAGSKRFEKLLEEFQGTVFGLTATPINQRGAIYGMDKFFTKINHRITFQELESSNYILPIRALNKNLIDKSKLKVKLGDYTDESIEDGLIDKLDAILADMVALCDAKELTKVAIWCPTIHIADTIKEKLLLMRQSAIAFHSKTEDNLDDFEVGPTRFVSFVNMISTGYDYPPLQAIASLRPTKLPHLWIQTAGRVARIDKKNSNKKCGYILDYAGNFLEHGHPYLIDFDIIAECSSIKEYNKKIKETQGWTCPQCKVTLHEKPEILCPECKYDILAKQLEDEKKRLAYLSSNAIDPESECIENIMSVTLRDTFSAEGKAPMFILIVNKKSFYYLKDKPWAMKKYRDDSNIIKLAKDKNLKVRFYKKDKSKIFWTIGGIVSD